MTAQSFREIVGVKPSTASVKDSVLVVIDAQNEYAEGKLKVANVQSSRKVIVDLVEKFQQGDGKVVHVKHEVPAGAPVFTPKTELAEQFPDIKPKSDKILMKSHPSCFADTDLNDYLKGTGLKKILLVGYMAHVCVSTTARDGDRYGYDVVIAEDGVGDRDIPGASGQEVTKMVMHELGDAFASIVQSSDVK